MTTMWMLVLLTVIAVSAVSVAVIFFWLSQSLIKSNESLRTVVGEIDVSVQRTIDEVGGITKRVAMQMDRVDEIVENVEHITADARSSMHMVDQTVFPALSTLKATLAGVRRGLEVWRETGEKNKDESAAAGE
jgi:hypothetical protein